MRLTCCVVLTTSLDIKYSVSLVQCDHCDHLTIKIACNCNMHTYLNDYGWAFLALYPSWLGLPLHCIASFTNHTPNCLSLDGVVSRQLLCFSFTVFFTCIYCPFSMCSPSVLHSMEMELFDERYCASAFHTQLQ